MKPSQACASNSPATGRPQSPASRRSAGTARWWQSARAASPSVSPCASVPCRITSSEPREPASIVHVGQPLVRREARQIDADMAGHLRHAGLGLHQLVDIVLPSRARSHRSRRGSISIDGRIRHCPPARGPARRRATSGPVERLHVGLAVLQGEHQFAPARREIAAARRRPGLHDHRPALRRARHGQRAARADPASLVVG